MKAFVVDTNVAVVANRQSPQAGPRCVAACIDALEEIIGRGLVVVDDRGLILDEYMKRLSLSGQPGAGDVFLKWVWNVQATNRVIKTTITPCGDGASDFAEFPSDPKLRAFDKDDRKYVAVALSCKRNPRVVNAVDSDWWDARQLLRKHGVRILFLCPEQFSN